VQDVLLFAGERLALGVDFRGGVDRVQRTVRAESNRGDRGAIQVFVP
jgi:hypothetical protein